jgi:plasmid stabilization system protein ParE
VRPVRLRRAAKRELNEAAEWYRERDPEVAARFLREVFRAIALVESFPLTGGPVFGVDDPDIRQLPVSNFPYHVVFKRLAERIVILAIAHDRRKPGYWRR